MQIGLGLQVLHLIDCILKEKNLLNLDHAYHVNEIMIKIYGL